MAVPSSGFSEQQATGKGQGLKFRDLISHYTVLGASLALMLQTNFRFAGPVGWGETLACIYFVWMFFGTSMRRGTLSFRQPQGFTLLLSLIVLLVIVPMTFFSAAIGTRGVSFQDLISYIFVLAVAVHLPTSRRDIQVMVAAFLVVLFATVTIQYLLGSSGAFYFSRFTGGARNPNQLALYMAVAVSLSAWLPGRMQRAVVVALSIFFGLASGSDAFLAFIAASVLALGILMVVPPRAALICLPLFLGLGLGIIIFTGVMETFLAEWGAADEGGSRVSLYSAAIRAWLDNPPSFLLGHGAGNFAGLNGPFGEAEAHNTVLDMATLAGVLGLFLFPIFPVWTLLRSLTLSQRYAAAMFAGLICYALFHFVGRQPVFWAAIILFARQMDIVAHMAHVRLLGLRWRREAPRLPVTTPSPLPQMRR